MIKKTIIKGFEAESANDKMLSYTTEEINKVKHIVNQLYKIKNINRKHPIDNNAKKTILNSPIGQKVLDELIEIGVTKHWLLMMEQDILLDIFENSLPEDDTELLDWKRWGVST